MLRVSAEYSFGLEFARFMPHNDDKTIPTPTRMLGGIGPFDFSGVDDISAVVLIIKFDNEAAVTYTVDLSGAVSAAAVTVRELRDAINHANPAEILALVNANGRIGLTYDGSDPPTYIQVYGECATISMFGQGLGLKFIKTDTLQSVGDDPLLKDEETITVVDANGLETTIITDGYRRGCTATVVDTVSEDYYMRELMEGGHYDDEAQEYESPTSEDSKIYFYSEIYYAVYTRGENKEADMVGYRQKLYRNCKGQIGSQNHAREFGLGNYTITAITYKDQNSELFADTKITELTVEAYEALHLDDV